MYKERVDSIANRLATALSIRRIKQAELCAKAKIPKSSLSQYLKGDYEPKQDRIYFIAQVLSVSEAWLMGYDVPMERQDPKKKQSPEEIKLSEGEQLLLELFRKIPEDRQEFFLDMVRGQLGKKE